MVDIDHEIEVNVVKNLRKKGYGIMQFDFPIEHGCLTDLIKSLLEKGYELGDTLKPRSTVGGSIGIYKRGTKEEMPEYPRYCGEIFNGTGWRIAIEPHDKGKGIEKELFDIIKHYLYADFFVWWLTCPA